LLTLLLHILIVRSHLLRALLRLPLLQLLPEVLLVML
jgi:hypothetical protein